MTCGATLPVLIRIYITVLYLPIFSCSNITYILSCAASASDETPISVHRLRPGDIKVVAAMGDSVTSGNGACNTEGNPLILKQECRGRAYSIGGEHNLTDDGGTIVAILDHLGVSLKGFSSGNGNKDSASAGFNVATPGAVSKLGLDQAKHLVTKLKLDKESFENDWKLLTIFLGSNDLCAACRNWVRYRRQTYVRNIQIALDYLHSNVPRMLVNLVSIPDVTVLQEVNVKKRWWCHLLHLTYCSCGKLVRYSDRIQRLQGAMNRKIEDLISSGRYDTNDNFTVVIQPFLSKSKIIRRENDTTGEEDLEYLSFDCFHPNEKGHIFLAYGLWNSMMSPVGQKPTKYFVEDELTYKCLTEDRPFVFTNKNS